MADSPVPPRSAGCSGVPSPATVHQAAAGDREAGIPCRGAPPSADGTKQQQQQQQRSASAGASHTLDAFLATPAAPAAAAPPSSAQAAEQERLQQAEQRAAELEVRLGEGWVLRGVDR